MLYLYKITNKINGKGYVGQTNNLATRWKGHCQHGRALYHAIKKYGIENFEKQILVIADNQDYMNDLEITAIQVYGTHISTGKGYNIALGGGGVPLTGKQLKKRIVQITEAGLKTRLKKGHIPHNKGKTDGVNPNKRKAVIWMGIEYASIREAAKCCGKRSSTICKQLKQHLYADCYYKDEGPDVGKQNKPTPIKRKFQTCICEGQRFNNPSEAARELGIKHRNVFNRLESNYFQNYYYEVDGPKKFADREKKNYKAIWCNGKRFESSKAAGKFFGIYASSINHRLNSPNFPDHYYEDKDKKKGD